MRPDWRQGDYLRKYFYHPGKKWWAPGEGGGWTNWRRRKWTEKYFGIRINGIHWVVMEVRKKEESRMILWVLIWATAYMENTIRGIDFGVQWWVPFWTCWVWGITATRIGSCSVGLWSLMERGFLSWSHWNGSLRKTCRMEEFQECAQWGEEEAPWRGDWEAVARGTEGMQRLRA